MLGSEREREFKSLFFMNQILPNLSQFGLSEFDKHFGTFRVAI